MADVASKVQKSETELASVGRSYGVHSKKRGEPEVTRAAQDGSMATMAVIHGLMTQMIKHRVFDGVKKM